jgi:hypothetical protein
MANGMNISRLGPAMMFYSLLHATSEFILPIDIWYSSISQRVLDLDSTMDIVVKEGDNEASATISYTDDHSKSYKLAFHLQKTEQMWTIDQII